MFETKMQLDFDTNYFLCCKPYFIQQLELIIVFQVLWKYFFEILIKQSNAV